MNDLFSLVKIEPIKDVESFAEAVRNNLDAMSNHLDVSNPHHKDTFCRVILRFCLAADQVFSPEIFSTLVPKITKVASDFSDQDIEAFVIVCLAYFALQMNQANSASMLIKEYKRDSIQIDELYYLAEALYELNLILSRRMQIDIGLEDFKDDPTEELVVNCLETLKNASESYDKDLITALALLRSASRHRYQLNFEDSIEALKKVEKTLNRRKTPFLKVKKLIEEGLILKDQNNNECIKIWDQAIKISKESNIKRDFLKVVGLKARYIIQRSPEVRIELQSIIPLALALQDYRNVFWLNLTIAESFYLEKKYQEALSKTEEAKKYSKWVQKRDIAYLSSFRATMLLHLGKLDDARKELETSIKLSHELDDRLAGIWSQIARAMDEFIVGNYEICVTRLKSATEGSQKLGYTLSGAHTSLILAECLKAMAMRNMGIKDS